MKVQKIISKNPSQKNFQKSFDFDKDTLESVMSELKNIVFDKNDKTYVESLGAKPPFENGEQAFDFIQQNNIKIAFKDIKPDDIHACWSFQDNTIYINEKYKNMKSKADILMISEAILHEVGHAKDNDDKSSLQEELDCLSLNVLAHIYHTEHNKDIYNNEQSFLFKEGVGIYKDLFFRFDKEKTELQKRLKDKYGFLNVESPNHPASSFVQKINTS